MNWIALSSVLRPRQHSIGYMGDGFYMSKDPTNSIKVLKASYNDFITVCYLLLLALISSPNLTLLLPQTSSDKLMSSLNVDDKYILVIEYMYNSAIHQHCSKLLAPWQSFSRAWEWHPGKIDLAAYILSSRLHTTSGENRLKKISDRLLQVEVLHAGLSIVNESNESETLQCKN